MHGLHVRYPLLNEEGRLSIIWIGVRTLGWTIGWFVTRFTGVDLSPKWAMFGATGALTLQVLTGLALYLLLCPVARLKL